MVEYQIMFFDWDFKIGFFHELVYLLIPLTASIVVVYYVSTKEQLIKRILRMLIGLIFGFILGTIAKGILNVLFFVPGMILFTNFEESSLINQIPNFLIHEVPLLCALLGIYVSNRNEVTKI
jgi:riboflavin transporter FmnP